MPTFWQLPFGIRLKAPDTALEELERQANEKVALGAWDVETDHECLHSRFETRDALVKFVVATVDLVRFGRD